MTTTIYKHADFEAPQWGEFASPPQDRPGYRSLLLSYNPMAYWRLGEVSGTTAIDESGNGHDASYVGGVQLNQPGALDYDHNPSVQLDGNSGWIDLPTGFGLAMNDPVTIMFWNHVRSAEVQRSFAFSIGGLYSPNRCLAHAPWNNNTLFWDYGTDDAIGRVSADYSPFLDQWTHVTLVSAGRLGSFKAVYLDGDLMASSSTSTGPEQNLAGGSISLPPAVSDRQHRGGLDEFAVFNQVLTAEQIRALYHAGVNVWT
ncbi:MAG: LamG-like jellyroll fold domain-containing protein [Planctomycetota bacterium]